MKRKMICFMLFVSVLYSACTETLPKNTEREDTSSEQQQEKRIQEKTTDGKAEVVKETIAEVSREKKPEVIVEKQPPKPKTSEERSKLRFYADKGFRVTCAALPRIGRKPDGTFILYTTPVKKGTHGLMASTSKDGMVFTTPTKENDRVGHPERTKLPSVVNDIKWRIYRHNGKVRSNGGVFGDGINSAYSTEDKGEHFRPDHDDVYTSKTKGMVGVLTSYVMNGKVYLLTMDGWAKDGNHRIYLLESSDGSGKSFSVLDDNPMKEKPNTPGQQIRVHVDPWAFPFDDGSYWVLTMKLGELYSFYIPKDKPKDILFRQKILSPSDYKPVGIDGYTLHDPSVVKLDDGRYRLYVAMSVPDTNDCNEDGKTKDRTYAIVSATTK